MAPTVEVTARPLQSELVMARLGAFLQARIALGWIFASALLAIGWGVARGTHHAIATHVVLPVLLVLVALPVLVVFAGVQGKVARRALTEGIAYRFDEESLMVDGATHDWREVDDAFRIGNVMVLVVRGSVHAIPRRAFETKSRWATFLAVLRKQLKKPSAKHLP